MTLSIPQLESSCLSVDPAASRGLSHQSYRPRRGLSIPAVTILDQEGRVIEDEQRRVFRFLAQEGHGADIIFGCGTNGEWNCISNDQRQRLILIEIDEVSRINQQLGIQVEAWVGVSAHDRADTLANLECALDAGADAAVIAPLSIRDVGDPVAFLQRDVSDLFDRKGKWLPIFLYDNASIAADPRATHIHTRDVKRLSRLQFVFGLKVSAPRRVLGNYTKGALHYKDKGEFGIYVGNAMLMFQVFKLDDGLIGRVREYWNRYLLHNELPIGVVAGPANALPREWQRAWRACYSGDERLMPAYESALARFSAACRFEKEGKRKSKSIACLKLALKLQGVIDSDRVAAPTAALDAQEAKTFAEAFSGIKQALSEIGNGVWNSRLPDEPDRLDER